MHVIEKKTIAYRSYDAHVGSHVLLSEVAGSWHNIVMVFMADGSISQICVLHVESASRHCTCITIVSPLCDVLRSSTSLVSCP